MFDLSSRGASNTPALHTEDKKNGKGSLRILVDWVGFTLSADVSRVSALYHVKKFFADHLGISEECWKPGRKNYEGYADSLVYENINIYYNGAENQGVHVDITGQGCRFLDIQMAKLRLQDSKLPAGKQKPRIHNWRDFFSCLYHSGKYSFTRVDVACDDFVGFLNVEKMFRKCLRGEIRMKFRSWRPDGNFDSNGRTSGITLYFGSPDSRLNVVFYEKNKQLKVDYHWTRCEIRFKKQRANEFVKEMLEKQDYDVGVIAAGILKNYLTFIEPSETDTNKWRWEVSPFWTDFLEGVPRLQIAAALPDRTIQKSRRWIDDQVSRTIARLYFAYKDINDNWFQEIFMNGFFKLNEEDLRMIEDFRRIYGKDYKLELAESFPFNQKVNQKENERSENERS